MMRMKVQEIVDATADPAKTNDPLALRSTLALEAIAEYMAAISKALMTAEEHDLSGISIHAALKAINNKMREPL